MKVGIIADIHLQGGFESKEAIALDKARNLFREQEVDLVCVAGDIYEGVSTEDQRLVFKEFLDGVNQFGARAIVLRGNHDAPKELLINHQSEYVTVFEKPGTLTVSLRDGSHIFLGVVPHFSAGAVALQSENLTEFGEKGTSLMIDLLNKMYQDFNNQKHPSMLLFHGTVSGAKLDNDNIPRHNGIHLPLSVLETLGVPVVGGHYHKLQNVGGSVWYPGSITRQTWGEYKDDKGVLIWEHNGTSWEKEPVFHSLNPQPMVSISAEFVDGKFIDQQTKEEINLQNIAEAGSKVRFRYTVKAEEVHSIPPEFKAQLQAIDPDAKIEKKTIHQISVRNAEIMEATGVEDSLRVYYQGRGLTDSEIQSILEIRREILEMGKTEQDNQDEVAA
ncbi:metallophosphoesterase family protein [Leptospira sp. GIMC2001]|uniref:metallophosphoesterase family protein n=1 Tax=Leptospira sp. GIMC2001 TaxID=1513297 RepID=UPI00234B43C4|nr:metallophosphoesterase [Leptospira sp. GIMC2001]WCL51456.1 metallophosphoesterase [Leptospira sp. GIMC2001]